MRRPITPDRSLTLELLEDRYCLAAAPFLSDPVLPNDPPWSVPTHQCTVQRDTGELSLVQAAGEGGAPRLRVLDNLTGQVLADFFVWNPRFRNGIGSLTVVPRPGADAVAVTPGTGGGPVVVVVSADGQVLSTYLAPVVAETYREVVVLGTLRVGREPDAFYLTVWPSTGGPSQVIEPLSGTVYMTLPGQVAPAGGDVFTGRLWVITDAGYELVPVPAVE